MSTIYFVLQEAQAYAEENSLLFMETSAKTAMNVNDIFLAIGIIHLLWVFLFFKICLPGKFYFKFKLSLKLYFCKEL